MRGVEGGWVSGTLRGTQVRHAKETESISVATGLVLVLAWGPALHTLPSPAGVGFFMGNHGNTFVSEAWPHLPPGFSLQQRLVELLLSPCTLQVPADCGPWASPGVGVDWISGQEVPPRPHSCHRDPNCLQGAPVSAAKACPCPPGTPLPW